MTFEGQAEAATGAILAAHEGNAEKWRLSILEVDRFRPLNVDVACVAIGQIALITLGQRRAADLSLALKSNRLVRVILKAGSRSLDFLETTQEGYQQISQVIEVGFGLQKLPVNSDPLKFFWQSTLAAGMMMREPMPEAAQLRTNFAKFAAARPDLVSRLEEGRVEAMEVFREAGSP